ncbi:hypothetical protein ACJX0J_006791, partial [Zea mays]
IVQETARTVDHFCNLCLLASKGIILLCYTSIIITDDNPLEVTHQRQEKREALELLANQDNVDANNEGLEAIQRHKEVQKQKKIASGFSTSERRKVILVLSTIRNTTSKQQILTALTKTEAVQRGGRDIYEAMLCVLWREQMTQSEVN